MRHFMLLLGIGTSLLASSACTTPPNGPLARAAVADGADAVRRLLAAGHPPDESSDAGITPLMWAARYGATQSMAALLDAGADANARDHNNRWTPLLHAVHKQRPQAVRLLLERGADADAAAPGGLTPLLMAAADTDPSTVEVLLEYGANPRAEGPGGATPLTQAVSGGAMTDIDRPLLGGCRRATVNALMTHDPILRVARTAVGLQAIWWARFHGCAEVLQLIGEQPTRRGQTAVSLGGVLHQHLREFEPAVERRADQVLGKPPDAPTPTPATDVPSRH
jgi:Ankyrin repeats (3 copies)/Ankyrin repeat